jgi:hypothetical protein
MPDIPFCEDAAVFLGKPYVSRLEARQARYLVWDGPMSTRAMYPDLTKAVVRPYVGRDRAADGLHAVLIGCVVLFCGFKPYEVIIENIPLNHNPKPELGSVNCLVKNILVFGPSPYQQRGFIIPSAMQMKIKDGDWGRVHALIRADEPSEYFGVPLVLKSEPFERLISQIDKGMADFRDKASSSCAPGVFPRDSKPPWRDIRNCIIEAAQINSVQEYIGPQLPLGGVLHYINSLTEPASLNDKSYELEHGDKRKDYGNPEHVPIGWRLFIVCFAWLCGFSAILWGSKYPNNQRRIVSAALIGGGVLLNVFGLGLWLVTLRGVL